MKNILFEAYIRDLLMLGEAENQPPKKTQGDPVVPDGLYAGKAPGTYYRDAALTQYAGMKRSGEWIPAADADSAAQKPAQASQPTQATQPAQVSQPTAIKPPKKPAGFKDQQLYDEFTRLLNGNDPAALQKFINDYEITYNPDKNTFYVGKDSSGKKLSGDSRKIFGDGKGKISGSAQKEFIDRLKNMGVEVKEVTTASPFSPERVAPETARREFDGEQNPDGSITFNGVTYEALPEGSVEGFVSTQYSSWLETPEGKSATEEQRRDFQEKLTVSAFAISSRHRTLSILLTGQTGQGREQVAVYDNDEVKGEFVRSLGTRISAALTNSPERQKRVEQSFRDIEAETDPDKAAEIMASIIRELSDDESPIFRQSGVIPSIVENFSTILEMKRGRTVVVPLRSNFKASDVISLSGQQTSGASPTELVGMIKSIYVGISVKFFEGGGSSMGEKTRQSVFRNHTATKTVLLTLANTQTSTGSLFDTDPAKKKARQDEVKRSITERGEEICTYYGINPDQVRGDDGKISADKLIEFLKNGPPECVDGVVVPRRKAPAPLSRGTDPDGNPIDIEAWGLTFAMQASWDAVYNSNVIGQSFASQTWTDSGVIEVDGLTRQAKQVMQFLKQPREGSSGMSYQPDMTVSKNKPTGSTEELRSGNPCGKPKRGKKKTGKK